MSKTEQFWDSASKNYDKTEERFEYIHNKSRESAKKFLKGSDVVLDFGCGTGAVSCQLFDSVKEIYGIDTSSRMIELANEKAAAREIENVRFEQADIFDEKHCKESYDAILAFNMLHTVTNPRDVMRRISELLKPEGVFISATPCLRQRMSLLVNLQIQLVRVLCKIGLIPIPIRRVTSSEIDCLLETVDLQTVESEVMYKGVSSYFVVAKKSRKT